MDHREVGRTWDDNADAWTHLARAGYDVCRDYLNTPLFFDMLPDVTGEQGLDIGCGEGHNTRLLAARCASLTGLDISSRFLRHACATELEEPLGIRYVVASALELPFAAESFDFVTAFMSFMDMPEQDRVLAEVLRILRPGGFLQFSITHPCYDTKIRRKVRDEDGRHYAYEVGGYWDTAPWAPEWIFSDAPAEEKERWPKFKTPYFRRTMSEWINSIVRTGFLVEELGEPYPSEEMLHDRPDLDDMTILPFFLHIRCRKP
jgi:ubiquinone/menaquinone biosynthesis C-methylase UbiE